MAKRDVLSEGESNVEQAQPSESELLAANKNHETGGDGPGGRPWVLTKTGVRRPQQGDQVRPQCPRCSTDKVAVLCGAYSSPNAGSTMTTRYKCPRCNYSVQKLRPGIDRQLSGQQAKPTPRFAERP